MNKKQRLEKLNKILNERRQNLEQGSGRNFDAENSDSKNFKFEKLTDGPTMNTNKNVSFTKFRQKSELR